jgi:hypothetical protein
LPSTASVAVGDSARADEGDGVLGAGDDAEPARPARVGVGGVGRDSPVGPRPEPADEPEGLEVVVVDSANFEDVIGADINAVTLSLATAQVDDRRPRARRCRAPKTGPFGIGRGPPFLLEG